MTNEQLLVMSQLATELYTARKEIESLKATAGNAKDYSEELKHLGQALEVSKSVAIDQRECKERAEKERDEARRKLGAWARLINFAFYERVNKFVLPKNTPKAVIRLIEEVIAKVEELQKECPLTLTEGGMAK